MPGLNPQSADVRFREIDLSTIIRSRDASRGAILLVSKKGRPGRFLVNDSQSFKNEYGIPDASVSFAPYCALNALNEVANLECVRVIGAGARWSGLVVKIVDASPDVLVLDGITGGVVDPNLPEWEDYVGVGETPLLLITPKSGPGSYADSLAIDIQSTNLKPPAAPTAAESPTGTLVAATYNYVITAISAEGETEASPVGSVVIATGPKGVLLTWAAVPGARGYKIYGRTGTNEHFIAQVNSITTSFLDDGSITPNPAINPPATAPTPTNVFTVRVFDLNVSANNPVEEWATTFKDQVDGNGVQLEATQQINAFSDYINVASYVPISDVAPTVYGQYVKANLIDGDSGAAPTNSAIAQAWRDNFGDPEQSQVNILINGGYTDVAVQQAMLAVAQGRGDAISILDVPSAQQDSEDAIAFRQLTLNANTSYGALYTPDVFVDDPDNGKRLYVPPSGWTAAVYARTDRVAGPQFQPAGLNRGLVDVLGLRHEYSEPQRTNLYNAQVNYIRNFRGAGISIFEATTLQNKQSALSWVSVRRMLNVIKVSLKDFLMYSIHEPNDDFTRQQIVTASSDYLQYWKDARGILDFQVIADESNNPPAKYNLGILTVTIFVTPVIPVHEIQVDVVITKAGMSWSEINVSNLG